METQRPSDASRWAGKLARRLRRRRRSTDEKRRPAHLEPLEPRLLLSGDFVPFAVDMAAAGNDLTVRFDAASQAVEVVDNPSAVVVASRPLASTREVIVTGTDAGDRLVLHASAVGSFGQGESATPAPPLAIRFDGGAGDDTLVGPALDVTWQVTAPDAGSVAGLAFLRVESLVGAADNEDSFVLAQGGSLGGAIAGGAGGFDSLVIEGAYQQATFRATGPDSGSVTLDGTTIAYVGLEPITSNLPAADVVIEFEPFIVDLIVPTTLSVSENASGDLVVAGPLLETVIVPAPSSSLRIEVLGLGTTVDLAGLSFAGDLSVHTERPAIADLLDLLPGDDPANRVLVSGDLALLGRNLTLTADRIRVESGVTVSTRPPAGNSGDISLSALEVVIEDGAALLAHAPSGFTGGDVRIEAREADDLAWFLGILNFRNKQASATVDVGAATIRGENVEITALAATAKVVEVPEALTTDTRAVVTGDVDGDGLADVILGNFGQPTLSSATRGAPSRSETSQRRS
jgi:hypothetical protein